MAWKYWPRLTVKKIQEIEELIGEQAEQVIVNHGDLIPPGYYTEQEKLHFIIAAKSEAGDKPACVTASELMCEDEKPSYNKAKVLELVGASQEELADSVVALMRSKANVPSAMLSDYDWCFCAYLYRNQKSITGPTIEDFAQQINMQYWRDME